MTRDRGGRWTTWLAVGSAVGVAVYLAVTVTITARELAPIRFLDIRDTGAWWAES